MDEIADDHQIIWLAGLQTWLAAGQLAAGQLAAGRARPAAAHRPPRGRPPQHGVRPSSYAGRGHPRRVVQKRISRPARSNIKDRDSLGEGWWVYFESTSTIRGYTRTRWGYGGVGRGSERGE